MNQISKVFLACACSLSGLTTQAQDQTVWSNDFSNASQPLNTVGRGVCRVNDGVFHSRSAYALFGNPEWKDYTCLSRHVPRKTPNRYRYGQASVHITALTVM